MDHVSKNQSNDPRLHQKVFASQPEGIDHDYAIWMQTQIT
jgi:hypothetical protein